MKLIRTDKPLPWNGGNAPTCPECNSGNAMLSYHGRRDALGPLSFRLYDAWWDDVQCRDCGLIVLVTPSATTEADIRQEGAKAFQEEVARCPYPLNSEEHKWWNEGFHLASDQYDRPRCAGE